MQLLSMLHCLPVRLQLDSTIVSSTGAPRCLCGSATPPGSQCKRPLTLWPISQSVDVIEKRHEALILRQPPLNGLKSVVLIEGEECWHQSIALFPALSLQNFVDHSFKILPQTNGKTLSPPSM